MAYGDFRDLSKRTASDKVLRDKSIDIANNWKNHGYQHGLASVVSDFLLRSQQVVVSLRLQISLL